MKRNCQASAPVRACQLVSKGAAWAGESAPAEVPRTANVTATYKPNQLSDLRRKTIRPTAQYARATIQPRTASNQASDCGDQPSWSSAACVIAAVQLSLGARLAVAAGAEAGKSAMLMRTVPIENRIRGSTSQRARRIRRGGRRGELSGSGTADLSGAMGRVPVVDCRLVRGQG